MFKTKNSIIKPSTVVLVLIFVLLSVVLLTLSYIRPAFEKIYFKLNPPKIYGGMTDELFDSNLYNDLHSGKSFCFLGDSITAGSEISDVTWYQPLLPYTNGEISNLSCCGWTVLDLIEHADQIPASDIYIIAIGVNDILFPDYYRSAKTPEEFADRCRQLAEMIKNENPEAKLYFIAPWTFISTDPEIIENGDPFRTALYGLCVDEDYYYINPNPIIVSVMNKEDPNKFMLDNVHPNAVNGVGLYSYAVLKADHEQN